MNVKWSRDQRLKYSATMKRKRLERLAKQNAKPLDTVPSYSSTAIDAEPVGVDTATKLGKQHDFLDNLWRTLTSQDKARAIAYLMRDIF